MHRKRTASFPLEWIIIIGVVVLAVALVMLMAGCVSPWGMNMRTQQERQLEESQATRAVAEQDTKLEGPAPITVTQGEGSTANIAPPESTKIDHKAKKTIGTTQGLESEESSAFTSKNPYTMLLLGAGLIVVAIGIAKLWGLVKNTSIGYAARAADQATRRMIDGMRARMQTETDPGKLDALKDAVLEAEAKLGGVA